MTDFRHITLGNDFAFAEVMRDPETCQCFLEAVLRIRIKSLVYIDKQKDLSDSYFNHGIRLDIYVEDSEESVYNVEVQNKREKLERVRYYQSGIDRRMLEKNADYGQLRKSFIIFVCNYDPSIYEYPLYSRESVLACPMGSVKYDDGSHAILLNARYNKKYRHEMPEVCEFLDLINAREEVREEDFRYPLGQRAAGGLDRLRKDEEKGVAFMTFEQKLRDEARHAREDGYAEGLKDGRDKGRNEMFERLVSRLMEAQSLSREEAEKILAEPV